MTSQGIQTGASQPGNSATRRSQRTKKATESTVNSTIASAMLTTTPVQAGGGDATSTPQDTRNSGDDVLMSQGIQLDMSQPGNATSTPQDTRSGGDDVPTSQGIQTGASQPSNSMTPRPRRINKAMRSSANSTIASATQTAAPVQADDGHATSMPQDTGSAPPRKSNRGSGGCIASTMQTSVAPTPDVSCPAMASISVEQLREMECKSISQEIAI